jgi:hypothetical protein
LSAKRATRDDAERARSKKKRQAALKIAIKCERRWILLVLRLAPKGELQLRISEIQVYSSRCNNAVGKTKKTKALLFLVAFVCFSWWR